MATQIDPIATIPIPRPDKKGSESPDWLKPTPKIIKITAKAYCLSTVFLRGLHKKDFELKQKISIRYLSFFWKGKK